MQISKVAATAIVNIPDIAMERSRGADVIAYGFRQSRSSKI